MVLVVGVGGEAYVLGALVAHLLGENVFGAIDGRSALFLRERHYLDREVDVACEPARLGGGAAFIRFFLVASLRAVSAEWSW